MRRLILLFILTLSITGCSITGRYYLRNLSDQPATVTIVLNDNTTSDKWDKVTFKYDDRVRNIRFGIFKSFKKELSPKQIDMARLEFTIPPKSTVFIGIGLNTGFWGGFQQAKIKVGNKEQSLAPNDTEQMNFKMRGLMKYTGHYDINL